MKTILVPTDFSDYALSALKVAAGIARRVNGCIKLVHVYNLPTSGVKQFAYYQNFFNEIMESAEEQLKHLLEQKFLKDIKVEKLLITDMLMWEIVTNERFKRADLIVIGSHGESGFSKAFIGSKAEKIIRLADAPVLTIKSSIDELVIKKIVFSSDFTENSGSVFKKIKFLINAYKAELHLLKVITPSDFETTHESNELIRAFKEKYAVKKCTVNIYNDKNIESGIINFSHEIGADLVAIPTHGRTGFAHLINGSLAESVAKHAPKPVLSIKIPDTQNLLLKNVSYLKNFENWGEG